MVGIILACPAFCQAGEIACCVEHCETSDSQPDDSDGGPRAPSEPVSCVCAGALKDGKASTSSVDLSDSLLDLIPLPSTLLPDIPLVRLLSRDGVPRGPTEWTGSLRLHAFLKNFRC